MSRLTYKLDEPIKTKYLNYEYNRIKDYDIDRCNFGRITDDMIFNKLGKLEDIEEQLGVDLITLFKILEQGYVYTTGFNKRMEKWYFQCIEGINKTTLGIKYLEIVFNENEDLKGCVSWIPDWRDYGKTWALTKEELEDDK